MAGKLKIKYCIWDVGGVIYPYTLKFVNEFMKSRTEDMAAFNENNGAVGFDYDAFVFEENGILPAGLPGLLEQIAAAAAGTVREMFGGRLVVISELDKTACLQ